MAPRQTSTPLNFRSAVAALIAGATLLVTAACSQSPEVQKQRAVERGEQYLRQGKTDEVIIEFRNARPGVNADYRQASDR